MDRAGLVSKARALLDENAEYHVVCRVGMDERIDEMAREYYTTGSEAVSGSAMDTFGHVDVGFETIEPRRDSDGVWAPVFTSEEERRKWYEGHKVLAVPFADIVRFMLYGPMRYDGLVVDPLSHGPQFPIDALRVAVEGGQMPEGDYHPVKFRPVRITGEHQQVIPAPRDGVSFEEELREAAFLEDPQERCGRKLDAAATHLERDGEIIMLYRGNMEDRDDLERRLAVSTFCDEPYEDRMPTVTMALCSAPAGDDGRPQVMLCTQPAQVPRDARRAEPDARFVCVSFEAMCRYIMNHDLDILINPFNMDTLSKRERALRVDATLKLDPDDAARLLGALQES